jgi:hypothetical protein
MTEKHWTHVTGLNQSAPQPASHLCNCIGCCRECGMCRTDPRHTPDLCKRTVAWLQERPR